MRHKTALVSALSMVGVLMAGATALGANMGILNGTDNLGELTAVSDTAAATTSSTETTGSTAAQAELISYQINGVGVVTLSRDGQKLFLESAEVGNWSYTVETQGKIIAMTFGNQDREVHFEAKVKDGQILVDVWEENVVVETVNGGSNGGTTGTTLANTSTTAPSTTSSTYDDDGYDDEYDDEYEDEYEDEHNDDDSEYEDEDDDHEDDDHEDDGHEGHEDDD